MTDRTKYVAINRQGETCHPHRHADGVFKAVRYVAGRKDWKSIKKAILFPETELPLIMADPDLYVRCSPRDRASAPALFRTTNITFAP